MTTSEFDSYRPEESGRAFGRRRDRRRRGGRRGRGGGADGSREMTMVEDPQFSSYYGRQVVKAPPWGHEIGAYLFLGGLAGGSALLAAGAQLTGRTRLRRSARLTAATALAGGTVALIADLGRPERFLYMLRTVKVTSPMSLGTWILSGFGAGAGVAAAAEADRVTGGRLPLGPLRRLLHAAEGPAGLGAAVLGAPLASYTGVLLSNTAIPTWYASRHHLPYVFVGSAGLASGGAAMITSPVREAGPGRVLACLGVVVDVVAMERMKASMHPMELEPLEEGAPGTMVKWAERLAIAGGVGTVLGGRWRPTAVLSGLALVTASALTRFGVLDAGLDSAKDPKHTIEPQKARLAARRAAGITGDSITTVG
ncbi:NrfD/PsrC family molybdoenzyme membrane anchor subunit [Nesterenkonia marinintestina]|uniref:NrfD/PsrC family molybdoenzyme membrane anchor subunit n=1 Tax=Nesterenkonia marinintestina TaxID=2979865 RepID=UPI0021C0D774|nr:NrfD/PsrC family molybdoenzyme membrane anchor subunit [Nesterenkonia sp. GX14115]